MTELLCHAPRCRGDDEPRQAAGQAYLCRACWTRMERHITHLPRLHHQLAQRLEPGGSDPSQPSVKREGHDPNLQLNFHVVELRSTIPGTLASWTRLVAEDRGVHAPAGLNPHSLATFLTTHAGWLAHQPFAGEVAGEMRQLHGQARAALYPRRVRRFTLPEPCPPCGGQLGALFDDDDDMLPAIVECDGCGQEWEPSEWLSLGRQIHGRNAA